MRIKDLLESDDDTSGITGRALMSKLNTRILDLIKKEEARDENDDKDIKVRGVSSGAVNSRKVNTIASWATEPEMEVTVVRYLAAHGLKVIAIN